MSTQLPNTNDAVFLVLVSGVGGFLGAHYAKQLLDADYPVPGIVRSLKDERKIVHVGALKSSSTAPLELVEADLLLPETWGAAVSGCAYVSHVGSPFPAFIPQDADEIIRPAVDGTLNVLRAIANDPASTVNRVVLTPIQFLRS